MSETGFFDLPDDNVSSKGKNTGGGRRVDPNIYDPDAKAHGGSYKAVLRFLPYQSDKALTKYTKYSAKFWNGLTKQSVFVDCPSNEGKPSILWTIETVIRNLKKEEPALAEELGKNFSRWYTHHSPVYIRKDSQQPALEGTIKIFKFRHQIDQLIEQQMNPEQIEGIETGNKKVNPYHLLNGKDFLCIVGMKTKDFRDWSKSKFIDEVTPFVFKEGDVQYQVKNDKESVEIVSKFLAKNTPSMDEYKHVSWTDETYAAVAEAVIAAIPHRAILERILEQSKDTRMNDLIREKLGKSSRSTASSIDSDPVEFKSTSAQSAKVAEIETAGASADEFDSLLNEL